MEGEECEECGSTVFEEIEGRIYCSRGHIQDHGPVVADDDFEFGTQGAKVIRRKEDKVKVKISKVLRGAKAYQLFLQSWQFLLWKQCHALVHQKGLPVDLWQIVRDLWILWLSQLENRLQDASTIMERSAETSDKVETATSSGNESDDGNASSRSREKFQTSYRYPKLIDMAALNYMAIIMLRRPVRLARMLRWILEEDIPYIRAIRHVPQVMKDRLPGEYHRSLDTTIRLPGPDDFQKAIYHRMKWFNASFGMVFPSLNHNLLLLDYIRQLALPLEVYNTARQLNKITNYGFAYPDQTTSLHRTRRQPTAYPESQLMSLVVVATKLLFPFDSDSIKRSPKHPDDPSTLRMHWAMWLEAKAHPGQTSHGQGDADGLKHGSEIHLTDNDILDLTDQQLDQYMDWYQRTWINTDVSSATQPQKGGTFDKDLLDMFPLPDVPPPRTQTREQTEQIEARTQHQIDERIKMVQHSLKSRRAIPEEEHEDGLDIQRPGARYLRFAKVEDLDHATPTNGESNVVKIFHEEAAEIACLSAKVLLSAINQTEEKIEQWLVERKREQFFASENSENSDHDDEVLPEASLGHGKEAMASSLDTSPRGELARDLGGLGIGQSPYMDDEDGDVGMDMLPE